LKIILLIISEIVLTQFAFSQTPTHILNDYKLVWSDDFNGNSLDTTKWGYRATGSKRQFGIVYKENSKPDGKGHLIIEVSHVDTTYRIGQVGTQGKFSQQYGYFECRAKMNNQLGPHVAFWLQSPTIQVEQNDPYKFGTEIDIFEYHTNEGKEFVYHNLHWSGYGEHHQHAGTKVKVENLDQGYHTFGLEWTSDEYIFYVDGIETWRTNEAISQIPEYIILSAELTGWGGDFSHSQFPDSVMFDYVRVYKKKI